MRYLIFIYLFVLGGLAYVRYSMLNNVMPSLSLWGYHSSSYIFACSAISSSSFFWLFVFFCVFFFGFFLVFFCFCFFVFVFFAGHQRSSQSDPHTNTGFGSFKLPTCGWLQKGRSHSHMYMESSLVWWLGQCVKLTVATSPIVT